LCYFSWSVDFSIYNDGDNDGDDDDDVDDDIVDDDDRILHIVRIMNILCYLSWSVDFSTYNDGDKDDNNDDVSTVYATDYSMTNIYLPIYHPP
jgi:hypothetical protein